MRQCEWDLFAFRAGGAVGLIAGDVGGIGAGENDFVVGHGVAVLRRVVAAQHGFAAFGIDFDHFQIFEQPRDAIRHTRRPRLHVGRGIGGVVAGHRDFAQQTTDHAAVVGFDAGRPAVGVGQAKHMAARAARLPVTEFGQQGFCEGHFRLQ